MRKTLLMAALAAAVVGGALGCGGKGGVKSAPPSVTTFTDSRDGQVYKIVQIDSQSWFAENLNYAAEGSKCYNNSADSCEKYGRLYDWKTAVIACPAGWHLPEDSEWGRLTDYVGGKKKAGMKLKSSTGWRSYKNVPAGTDEYGFSSLPGGVGLYVPAEYGFSFLPGGVGLRDGNFYYASASYEGYWWSANERGSYGAWYLCMYYNHNYMSRDHTTRDLCSVRCVANIRKEAKK